MVAACRTSMALMLAAALFREWAHRVAALPSGSSAASRKRA
jgi:hypothetical protein